VAMAAITATLGALDLPGVAAQVRAVLGVTG
jgi:hypothetical protein